MNWMEVSLSVNGELAEAVADVFARFAPNGVVTEQGVKYRDEEDEGTGDGPITVCAYLPADEEMDARRRSIEDALERLRMIQPLPVAAFNLIPDQNWMEAWKRHYRPIPIGRRLVIMPAWLDQDQAGRVAIKIDPGMAFGTGTHPTTQLCLELLEAAFGPGGSSAETSSRRDRINVIDVGCGSGILSIAALKLGAAAALAVDIDTQAIDNARQNAHINGVGHELTLAAGSVHEILAGHFSIQSADLVLVNILAPVIVRLFDAGLAELIAPGGSIVLSGILQDQAEAVIAAADARGLHLKAKRQVEDWVALLMGT
jgi:ribosomal protein L11 methyltransferase